MGLTRAWMMAGFQNHFGATQHRLRGQASGNIPWQTSGDAAVAGSAGGWIGMAIAALSAIIPSAIALITAHIRANSTQAHVVAVAQTVATAAVQGAAAAAVAGRRRRHRPKQAGGAICPACRFQP